MRVISILILSLGMMLQLNAQELNIDVKVTAPVNTTSDKKVFETLERSIYEFYNNIQWTEDEYEPVERIKGTIQFNIVDEKDGKFTADVIVQSERPVFGSVYVTPMINWVDKGFEFNYDLLQPVQRSDNVYIDPLSSLLTYYAYVILALDYDSFEQLAGDEYWNRAQDVINAIPAGITNGTGWDSGPATVRRNRYWLVENMLNPKVRAYRQGMYEYHRKGLDTMHDEPDRARAIMLNAVNTYADVNNNYSNSMALKLMADSKRDELLEIFAVGDKGQKSRVRTTMIKIDPTQADRYNALK